MSRKLMFYILGIAIGFVVLKNFIKKPESTPTPSVIKTLPTALNAHFKTDSIGTEDAPLTIVSLIINDKTWLLDTVSNASNLDRESMERYLMPKDAIAAAGGWFAGAGDYFYVQKQSDTIKVFQGWQAEEQTDEGFHYEVIKKITANDF